MYLGSYEFDGDPDQLLAGYDTLMASFPVDLIIFHTCVRTDDGIPIIDGCPDLAETSVRSRRAPRSRRPSTTVGLPRPTVVELGTVHAARTREGVLADRVTARGTTSGSPGNGGTCTCGCRILVRAC